MSLRAPNDARELLERARALEGCSLNELGRLADDEGVRRAGKGRVGRLIERALGASNGSEAGPDFPALGIELKTLPIDRAGRVRESTFVCKLSLRQAERLDFEASPLLAKLQHVLWVPIVHDDAQEAQVGRAFSWRLSSEQRAALRADYDDLVGMIAIGKVEALDARAGRWLQVRPKAANGRARTRSFNEDGEPLWTMPRGFYLRPSFTAELLRAQSRSDVTDPASRARGAARAANMVGSATMPSDDELRKQRAAARASWPGRKLSLEEEGTTDDLSHLTVRERIALVWRLTQDAWASSGKPFPDYTRADIPGRVIRRRDTA